MSTNCKKTTTSIGTYCCCWCFHFYCFFLLCLNIFQNWVNLIFVQWCIFPVSSSNNSIISSHFFKKSLVVVVSWVTFTTHSWPLCDPSSFSCFLLVLSALTALLSSASFFYVCWIKSSSLWWYDWCASLLQICAIINPSCAQCSQQVKLWSFFRSKIQMGHFTLKNDGSTAALVGVF